MQIKFGDVNLGDVSISSVRILMSDFDSFDFSVNDLGKILPNEVQQNTFITSCEICGESFSILFSLIFISIIV